MAGTTGSRASAVLGLVKRGGIVRPRDLKSAGVSAAELRRLYRRGLLVQPHRGLYMIPNAEVTERHSLAEACKRVPHAVVCLISALEFHGLTTHIPHEVWLAIPNKARTPRPGYPPLRVVRFSGAALMCGVEEHSIEGVPVRVTCPAKTVADCFKYRNKIGLDVALEALRDCWRQRLATMDELWRFAQICRVANVMRPYLESVA
jgi:predicted transcriptional regulator of viral defense system